MEVGADLERKGRRRAAFIEPWTRGHESCQPQRDGGRMWGRQRGNFSLQRVPGCAIMIAAWERSAGEATSDLGGKKGKK